MIAVDTNLLVYAHRKDNRWHEPALRAIKALAEGRATWAIPWPCIHEFLGIVTHPRIYNPPTPLDLALKQVSVWLNSPGLVVLSEGLGHWQYLSEIALAAKIQGPQIHDARIAAICLHHGVGELWTADRDFGRFPNLKTRNPLVV